MVISKHANGFKCAYDSRHRILKVSLERGVIVELGRESVPQLTFDRKKGSDA
jgi:hypothetical protein